MTVASNDKATVAPSEQARRRTVPRFSSASSELADRTVVTDPEAALEEQLQDARYTELRAEMGQGFVQDLALPNYGDVSVPGFKLIPIGLAQEFGLAGFEEGDPLEEIDLEEPTPEPVGAIDGNTVATFVDGITGQHLFDVLNSTLLAQLAANVKYDREGEPIPWTRYYSTVLENIGWVVPAFTFFGLRSRETRFSMDSAVLKVIRAIMSQRQVEIVEAAFEALEALNSDDRRLQIFRRNSVQQNHGNFQIDSAGESAGGLVSLQLCAFHFTTDEAVTDVLWFRFNSGSTQLQATRTTLVLNDQVYDRLRQPVLDKLQNKGLNFLAGLPELPSV